MRLQGRTKQICYLKNIQPEDEAIIYMVKIEEKLDCDLYMFIEYRQGYFNLP
jgi:hypothetical protein